MIIFFFTHKTAYGIMPSLVGSEMCIRGRLKGVNPGWKYTVQFDNEGTIATCDGYQLKYEGVSIHLDGPLTSQLLLVEAEETA